VPWVAHAFADYLEEGLDSLGLERQFETGITDADSLNGTENLHDYADYEEDARCPESLGAVAPEEVLRQPPSGIVARCRRCGKTVTAYLSKQTGIWSKATHYGKALSTESEDPTQ
jgi:hypothetical protein